MIYILIIILFIACLLLCHVERSETSIVEILRCTQNDILLFCHIERSEISHHSKLTTNNLFYYDANGNYYIANIWRKRPRLCLIAVAVVNDRDLYIHKQQTLTNLNSLPH